MYVKGMVFMDKKTIIKMIDNITDQDIIDYLYIIVLDAYQESCCEQVQERSPSALGLTE